LVRNQFVLAFWFIFWIRHRRISFIHSSKQRKEKVIIMCFVFEKITIRIGWGDSFPPPPAEIFCCFSCCELPVVPSTYIRYNISLVVSSPKTSSTTKVTL
jgi:hypothetical protein